MGTDPGASGVQVNAQPVTVTLTAGKQYQTISHFGGSDAWACQFVGTWPDAKRNALADLLFSRDTLAGGQPKGIGLSLWRFNIGAGTAEQGAASDIRDEWRRAESFLNADGTTYNWDKQAGQVWFLEAARKRGVPEFLVFPNSPPVQFTINKKGYAHAGKPNLTAENFGLYADFLASVIAGIQKKTGVTIQYISPVNEPQWDWSDAGQEGTPFYNNEIAGIVRALSASLVKAKLPAKINIAEAGQIDYLYSPFNKQGRGNQIHAFFDKTSPDYIGSLPNLAQAISGHSYFTTSPYNQASQKRRELAAAVAKVPGLQYWMSEYCILGDNDGEIQGNGKDLGIDAALYVAKVIHNDLVNANASAWHWWTSISAYNYKDGLVYIDKNKTDGNFEASKMLWTLGNYSRFVRPGATRIDVSDQPGLLISAYKNVNNQLVAVIVNEQKEKAAIDLKAQDFQFSNVKIFRTSAQEDLKPVAADNEENTIIAEGRSITTIVADIIH
ncbi:xylanase [Dyadobacter sandarakinus]|uniref:Xylanase n=2 Tax=Dyadobacter sandarakinus TaxID=2747268 RepID=A0ABX7IE52_9BACT|nr:xylanase [Dyadobacter sandarakinus]